jgi:hypothetical protein
MLGQQHNMPNEKVRYNARKVRKNATERHNEKMPQPMRPPNLSHHATCTPDPRDSTSQEGMRRRNYATARINELILGSPPVLQGEWMEETSTPSKEEWRHPKAPPRRCRTSQQEFLLFPSTTSPKDRKCSSRAKKHTHGHGRMQHLQGGIANRQHCSPQGSGPEGPLSSHQI